jgi:hypothetical protein
MSGTGYNVWRDVISLAEPLRNAAINGAWGCCSAASSLCTTAHPLHNRIANIFGASLSEATMRPNPRCCHWPTTPGASTADKPFIHKRGATYYLSWGHLLPAVLLLLLLLPFKKASSFGRPSTASRPRSTARMR